MTSANVFNLNSVKQGQVLNANAAKGRSKAENPDAAGVFASLMGSNYSTNFNMPSVNTKINNNVLQQTNAADNYDRYQYQDNTIRQAAGDVVTDVIGSGSVPGRCCQDGGRTIGCFGRFCKRYDGVAGTYSF